MQLMIDAAKVLGVATLLAVVLLAGTTGSGVAGEKSGTSAKDGVMTRVSSLHRGEVMGSVNTHVNSRSSNFSAQNERAAAAVKAKPKTKKIVFGLICVVLFSLLIFSMNSARYYSIRICSFCSYNGEMAPVTLSRKKSVNKLLLLMVKIVPELLYFYSKTGRFQCPKCYRIHTHISIKSNPDEVDTSMKGLITKSSRKRHKHRKGSSSP
jgi:hypothetical protein